MFLQVGADYLPAHKVVTATILTMRQVGFCKDIARLIAQKTLEESGVFYQCEAVGKERIDFEDGKAVIRTGCEMCLGFFRKTYFENGDDVKKSFFPMKASLKRENGEITDKYRFCNQWCHDFWWCESNIDYCCGCDFLYSQSSLKELGLDGNFCPECVDKRLEPKLKKQK